MLTEATLFCCVLSSTSAEDKRKYAAALAGFSQPALGGLILYPMDLTDKWFLILFTCVFATLGKYNDAKDMRYSTDPFKFRGSKTVAYFFTDVLVLYFSFVNGMSTNLSDQFTAVGVICYCALFDALDTDK